MPIDIATGDVELAREDFVLPGRVPLTWTRHFRTALIESCAPLAPGWTTSFFASLKRVGKEWHFTTGEGDLHIFADPEERIARGHTIRLLGAFLELVRSENRLIVTQWDVDTKEIQRFVFAAERSGDGVTLLLVGIEDVCGDGLELTWDGLGRMTNLRQRIENRTVVVNYSPGGRIDSLHLMTNDGVQTKLVGYEYDASGRLLAAFDRRGFANRYEYDAHSRITREMLKDGAVYSYKYDEKGRCIRFSGLDHYNEKRLQFLDTARTTIVTNSYGKSKIYRFLPSGQIVAEINPTGKQNHTTFDDHGRIVTRVDENGATTRFTYDQYGNRNSTTDPLGNTSWFVFDAHHQPVSFTNPLGKTWHREYDVRHRPVATRSPLGARWLVAYDEAGNPSVITDPVGSSRRLLYEDGLPREMTDWMGHVTKFNWDKFGRITERIGPTGERTVFHYDPAGNPIEVELPDGQRLRATYDGGSNLSSFTNAKGRLTRFRYGPCRRLLQRVDAMGRVIRYTWGTEPERLDSVINEKGEAFTYFRDDQGRVVREKSFDGREQEFEYDAAGRVVSFTNGNGDKTQLKRDAAGQLVEKAFPDGAVTRYEYDAVGKIVTAVNPDISLSFEYDDAGRLVREIQGDRWVLNGYNAAGELVRTSTSLGHEVSYELDPNGRVKKFVTARGHSISFERDARGLETHRQMPGAMRMEQRFDAMGRLLVQRVWREHGFGTSSPESQRIRAGDEVIRRGYRYDADGILLSLADDRWGLTEYAYDAADRPLSALRRYGLNEQFDYDVTNNLLRIHQQSTESVKEECTYDLGNRLLQRGATRYEYDPDGRLVRKTEAATGSAPRVWEYRWDVQGQLRRLSRPDGQEWEYKYDAFGRRVAKRGPTSGCDFLWDGNVVIQELPHQGPAASWIFQRGGFEPLARTHDGDLYPIITDQIGTPREMLDSSGKVVWAASFSTWGQIERIQNLRPQQNCPIRFQGQWFDEESGLYYSRFRYFDPLDGRFITADPIRLLGGSNLYQYAQNPTASIDPFGLGAGKPCGDSVPADDPDRPELPPFDGKTTHAVLVTNEGHIVPLTSGGRDPAYANYNAAGHTEGKAAIYIRENGSTGGIVYHNNPNGTCGFCDRQVETLLPQGATLIVVPPANAVPNNSMASAKPTGYVGDSNNPKPVPPKPAA